MANLPQRKAMRILRPTFGLMVAFATLCNFTAAREIYVNNATGSDLLDGTLAGNSDPGRGPFRSITRALKAVGPGDHIIVANTQRSYRECITLEGSRHSGTPYQPFSIESAGAVLDGSRSVPPDAWQHVTGDVFRFQPLKKEFAQVFLDGAPGRASSGKRRRRLAHAHRTQTVGFGRRLDLLPRRAAHAAAAISTDLRRAARRSNGL